MKDDDNGIADCRNYVDMHQQHYHNLSESKWVSYIKSQSTTITWCNDADNYADTADSTVSLSALSDYKKQVLL